MKLLTNRIQGLSKWLMTFSVFLLFLGCSESEVEMKEIESKIPEETSSRRYDHPDVETGFSPEEPFGHCMVFAGYDSEMNLVFFADPADNMATGHVQRAVFKPHAISLINGFCTTVVGGEPATFTGAIIVSPPDRNVGNDPVQWTQFGMPDLSQHIVDEWNCYCAPTSAANLIYYFSESYPEMEPQRIFASEPGFVAHGEWLQNRLIGGAQPPYPQLGSMAEEMGTEMNSGSSLQGMLQGMKDFIDDHAENPENWEVRMICEDEENPDGAKLLEQLKTACAEGDGILLAVMWGVPLPSGTVTSSLPEETTEGEGEGEGSNEDSETRLALEAESESNPLEKDSGVPSEPDPEGSPSFPKPMTLIPEKEYPEAEHEPKIPREVLDVETVIVDDFDLEERAGIWYRKGEPSPFTGIARRFYPSGSKLLEIPYLNGEREGMQRIWKENGELQREVMWRKGKVLRNP